MALQLIIAPCANTKCDLGEVKKGTMLVVARHCEFFFSLDQPKIGSE